jgi:hypothetical protein
MLFAEVEMIRELESTIGHVLEEIRLKKGRTSDSLRSIGIGKLSTAVEVS